MIILSLLGLGCILSSNFAQDCSPGQYERYSGGCMTCPRGTYSEDPPSFKCLPCPDASTTLTEGASNETDCEYDRIGCYDNLSTANVTDLSETDPSKTRSCVDYCAMLGYTFAAIQNATSCFCALSNDGVSSSGCSNTDCGAVDMCGGPSAMTVYRTGRRRASFTTIGGNEADLKQFGLNVSGMGDFDFRALGCKDAHVALMYDRGNYTDRFIQVIFGVSNNVRIGIRTEKGGVAAHNKVGSYMDCYNWKQFRISWNNGTISVFIHDENQAYSFDTGIVFDVNYIVLSAFGTVQVCWQVFADIEHHEDCPPLPTTTTVAMVTAETTATTTREICECPCALSNYTDEELQEKVEELKRILTVDVKTTSQYERKLVCADDPRPSAKGIGIVFGPVLISVVIGLIVLADFPNLVKSAIRLKRAIMRMNKYRKNKYKQDKDKKDDSSGQSKNNEETKKENNSQEETPDSTNSTNEIPEKTAKTKTAWPEQSKTAPLNNRPRPPYIRNSVPKRVENKFPKSRLNVKGENKPSNVSSSVLKNQKTEECNEIEASKKNNAVKKPINLQNRNTKNSNVSKNVNIK